MSGPQAVSKPRAIEILNESIAEIAGLKELPIDSLEFQKWKRDTEIATTHIFGSSNANVRAFKRNSYFAPRRTRTGQHTSVVESKTGAFLRGLDQAKVILESMITEIERFWA